MTNKKFLFIGMAVLLSVSLFLTGCGDPAAGAEGLPGQSGQNGENGQNGLPPNENFSQSASVAALQDAIEHLGTGATLRLDNVTVTGGGTVDFGASNVRVIGGLKTDADNSTGVAILNLAEANVTFVSDAKVELGHLGDVAVLTAEQLANNADTTTGIYAAKVDGPESFDNVVGTVTAVNELTLTNQSATYPADLKIYVYGTLKLDSAVAPTFAGSGKVIAIKNVEVSGTTGDVSDTAKVDVSLAQISVKSGETAATIKLPETFEGRFALAEGELTLAADTTELTAYMLPGNGVLKLPPETVTVAITGNGRIAYTGSSAVELATGSSIVTGTGYVSFPKGITLDTSTITLDGNVAIGSGETITIGETGSTVTLNSGTTVYVGAATAGNEILTASGEGTVVLSGDGAVLTITAAASPANQKLAVAMDLEVAGDVTFGGDLTLTDAGVTFDGDTLFAEGAVVTLVATDSIITLKGGAVLSVPVAGSPAWGYILSNANETATNTVTLTPAANTTLTFGPERILTQSGSGATHGIAVSGTGTATLVAGAAYVVASASGKVGTLTIDTSKTLTLAEGVLEGDSFDDYSARLVLTGATETNGALLKGAGKVVAGDTEISGGDDGWQAVGTGTVALAVNSITAAAALTAQHANSLIEVTAGTLTVNGTVTLASSKGVMKLTGDGDSTGGSLLLKGGENPGLLVTGATASADVTVSGATASNFMLYPSDGSASSDTKALVTKDGVSAADTIVLKASGSAKTGVGLGNIGGGSAAGANDALITGPVTAANASQIANGWKVQVPDGT
jgi:hypothetical protein